MTVSLGRHQSVTSAAVADSVALVLYMQSSSRDLPFPFVFQHKLQSTSTRRQQLLPLSRRENAALSAIVADLCIRLLCPAQSLVESSCYGDDGCDEAHVPALAPSGHCRHRAACAVAGRGRRVCDGALVRRARGELLPEASAAAVVAHGPPPPLPLPRRPILPIPIRGCQESPRHCCCCCIIIGGGGRLLLRIRSGRPLALWLLRIRIRNGRRQLALLPVPAADADPRHRLQHHRNRNSSGRDGCGRGGDGVGGPRRAGRRGGAAAGGGGAEDGAAGELGGGAGVGASGAAGRERAAGGGARVHAAARGGDGEAGGEAARGPQGVHHGPQDRGAAGAGVRTRAPQPRVLRNHGQVGGRPHCGRRRDEPPPRRQPQASGSNDEEEAQGKGMVVVEGANGGGVEDAVAGDGEGEQLLRRLLLRLDVL